MVNLALILARFLTEFWFWVIPSVSSTWMHDWSAVMSLLAAWGRMTLIFYEEICISQVTYSSSILTASIILPRVPPHRTWLTVRALFWSRLTCFICPHVVSFLRCLFGARGSAELESDEKSSFWKGKKLLPVQFCSFKEEGDCVCGVTCHPFKLQGIPVAWVLALPVHFLPMNAEYSHSIP